MGPFAAIGSAFAKAFNFKGRASRSEFWWFFLFIFIVQTAALAYDLIALMPILLTENYAALMAYSFFDSAFLVTSLLLFVPLTSIQIRRLHDAGFSGFWYLLTFVPFGGLALLIMYIVPSEQATSIYGPPPFGGTDHKGRIISHSDQERAMQGYACLFEVDKEPTPEIVAARKAEISEYYRTKVLKTA